MHKERGTEKTTCPAAVVLPTISICQWTFIRFPPVICCCCTAAFLIPAALRHVCTHQIPSTRETKQAEMVIDQIMDGNMEVERIKRRMWYEFWDQSCGGGVSRTQYPAYSILLMRWLLSTSLDNNFDVKMSVSPTPVEDIITIISTCFKPAIIEEHLRTI